MTASFNHYIYAYIRQDGTPYYIGKGVGRRFKAPHGKHIAVPKDRNRIVLMETNLSQVGALALERRYIAWHGRKANGTGILRNLTDGGEGIFGYKHTEEYKKQSSESRKGKGYWKGKKIPKETVEKLRQANLGRPLSEDHKQKIREANLGRVISEETRMKLSLANKGKPSPRKGQKLPETVVQNMRGRTGSKSCMYGKKMPDDVKKKISLAMKGKQQKMFTCPHCDKTGNAVVVKWHFDNCKQNPQNKDMEAKRFTCIHCGLVSASELIMKRWHFDKCKLKKE